VGFVKEPEISIERLSSNQSFIDGYIDQEILKQLSLILSAAPEQEQAQTAASTSGMPSRSFHCGGSEDVGCNT